MQNTLGILKDSLFENLYRSGYGGGLPWSWTDVYFSSHADMLAGMQYMWYHYTSDVDVDGIGGYWPTVSITSPRTDTTYVEGSSVSIVTAAQDSDGTVVSVKLYADAFLIGEQTVAPFSMTWSHPPNGQYSLTAVATDNQGHQRTSALVRITVGTPPMTKREAEGAVVVGSGLTRKSDPTASGGMYLDMGAQTGELDNSQRWRGRNLSRRHLLQTHYDHPKIDY